MHMRWVQLLRTLGCMGWVQSLRALADGLAARGLPGRAQLVWLLDCARNVSDAELDAFARYGTGIGPEKVPHFACLSIALQA